MIVARLEQAVGEAQHTPGFEKAFKFLVDAKGKKLQEGRVEIEGDRVYAMVQSYETKCDNQPVFEAHRKYVDIQYIVAGEELIGWVPLDKMTAQEEYNPVKDVTLGKAARGDSSWVKLRAGELGVFFPSDAHAPKQAVDKPSLVYKIVVKVAV
jgi:YhcH/YjgK/YiaL family protein